MEFLLVFLGAIFKFQYTLIYSTFYQKSLELTLLTALFGFIGCVLFTYFGEKISTLIKNKLSHSNKRFSRKTRYIVKFRNYGGFLGVAILSPILLGIPLGLAILLTMSKDKESIITISGLSVFIWSLFFYAFAIFVHF